MNVAIATALALALAARQGQQTPPAGGPGPAQQPAAPAQAAPPQLAAPPAAPATVITLDEALQMAASQNLDLRAAQARLRQSNEASWKAWSGYLPQLTVSGAYTRNQYEATIPFPVYSQVRTRKGPASTPNNFNPDNPSDPGQFASILHGDPSPYFLDTVYENITLQQKNQLAAQASVTQMIFSPQLMFAIRAAYAGEDVARATIDGVRRDILFGVAQAYYGVASLKRALQVSQQLLEIAQRQERDAKVRFQAGTIAKVGLLRAEIDRARAEQDVKRAGNAYESTRLGLALLLNRPADFDVADPPEPQLPANPSELEEAAVRDRPEVKAARADVSLAHATRNAAAARYLPNVSAFGNWQISNITGFTGKNSAWTAGLGAQWSIFDGGRRESDLREGNARIDEAIATEASTEQKVRNDVRQGVLDLDSARANASKAKEQRDLAAENQRLVDVSYRAGAATAVEQADATAALRNAEIAFTAESLAAQLAALRVLRAAGAFHPTRR